MIFGLGTDVVEIHRVEAALQRWGERFARKILVDFELKRFSAHRLPANYLAKRFAAKEAFAKALGTGIRSPASWHGMWVVNLPSGKPVMEFAPSLQDLLKKKQISATHLSLSDEKGIAFATVILESGR
jgi:holo-[acyl-carrier protein] synthase